MELGKKPKRKEKGQSLFASLFCSSSSASMHLCFGFLLTCSLSLSNHFQALSRQSQSVVLRNDQPDATFRKHMPSSSTVHGPQKRRCDWHYFLNDCSSNATSSSRLHLQERINFNLFNKCAFINI